MVLQTEDPTPDQPADEEPAAVAGGSITTATARPWNWPDLIVDIGCAGVYEETLAASVGQRAPVTVDVGRLLNSGASTVIKRASAIVFGDRTRTGLPTNEPIEQLRASAPHVGVYVLAPSGREIEHWLPLFLVSGVDEIFALDSVDGMKREAWTLRQRLAAPAPETELRLLWKWFRESPERSLIMHCVRNSYWSDNWARRATVFGATRRTLLNRLSALRVPSPGLLARCGRMLHAQELERRGMQADDVARALGLPSASALRRARRRVRHTLLAKGPQGLVFASLLR